MIQRSSFSFLQAHLLLYLVKIRRIVQTLTGPVSFITFSKRDFVLTLRIHFWRNTIRRSWFGSWVYSLAIFTFWWTSQLWICSYRISRNFIPDWFQILIGPAFELRVFTDIILPISWLVFTLFWTRSERPVDTLGNVPLTFLTTFLKFRLISYI